MVENGEGVAAVVAVVVEEEEIETFPTPLRTSALPHGVGCAQRLADASFVAAASSLEERGRRRTTTLKLRVFENFKEKNQRG